VILDAADQERYARFALDRLHNPSETFQDLAFALHCSIESFSITTPLNKNLTQTVF
jgi:hypothetical protein